MKKLGDYTLIPECPPAIVSYASIVGKKEAQGPLGKYFDQSISDAYIGMKSFEQAEAKLQTEAVHIALRKASLDAKEIDMVFAGDLLNQCISSIFGMRSFEIPFLGQFGACSTMAQTLLLSCIMVDCGAANNSIAVTSSHFCTAERQFRLPLEYGGQRAPTAQWTATGAGAVIVGKEGRVKLTKLHVGKIIDLGITDSANMGAAMAPAAATSIYHFLSDTNTKPDDYDAIFTGDLGLIGSELLLDILKSNDIDISENHKDCGVLMYDIKKQDVHSGSSGCGCSAAILCGYILREFEKGNFSKILFCATGALMSPTSSQQGESIPGICHIVELSSL